MTSHVQEVFRTSETSLSAYLISEGFDFPSIDYENGTQAYFSFSKTPELQQKIDSFDTGRAIGNIVLFFNAYQTLLRRIRER